MSKSRGTFHGILAALVTPFDKQGELAPEMAQPLIDRLLDLGIHGLYVGGSTGEGYLQSVDERAEYLRYVSTQVRQRSILVAQVGALSARDAWALTAVAEDAGYDAISSTPPFYYSYSENDVAAYYAELSERSSIPLILYNAPHTTGCTLSLSTQRNLLELPNVIGTKHTDPNFFTAERLISANDGSVVFSGPDDLLLGALAMGMTGAIGTTYNLIPRYALDVYRHVANDELNQARKAQKVINDVIEELMRVSPSIIPGLKLGLRIMGFDVGQARKPLQPVSEDTQKFEALLIRYAGLSANDGPAGR